MDFCSHLISGLVAANAIQNLFPIARNRHCRRARASARLSASKSRAAFSIELQAFGAYELFDGLRGKCRGAIQSVDGFLRLVFEKITFTFFCISVVLVVAAIIPGALTHNDTVGDLYYQDEPHDGDTLQEQKKAQEGEPYARIVAYLPAGIYERLQNV